MIENNFCLLSGATKAVKDYVLNGRAGLFQNLYCFIEGFSAVYNDRQIEFGGDLQVLGEYPSLVLAQ